MAKVGYKKQIDFKLFGKLKLFSINVNYVERSRNVDYVEDDYYVELDDRIMEQDEDQ